MATRNNQPDVLSLVASMKPDLHAVARAWPTEQRDALLGRIVADDPAAKTPHRRADSRTKTSRTKPPGRRWLIAAAAATVLAGAGLAAQTVIPTGQPGSPQTAAALDTLAQAAVDDDPIPAGHYELTVTENRGTGEVVNVDTGQSSWQDWTSRRSTWLAADGWSWARQTGADAAYYIFPPIPRPYALDSVPAEPQAIIDHLREHVTGSMSINEATFEAITEDLVHTHVPAAHRAAAIRALAYLPGVTVTNHTPDPAGRTATKVTFTEPLRPGVTQSVYFNPTDSTVLATQDIWDGTLVWHSTYTERTIVPALPDDIATVLGTQHTERYIPEKDAHK